MASQTIYHKSKLVNYQLNFDATEGNLVWSITAEGDSVIYQNPIANGSTTNVATLTIDNAAPIYPFTLVAGTQYAIGITKITNGQIANVTLKSRRQTDKTTTKSVPNFAGYTGRWLYILGSNSTVYKYDSLLLKPSNYAGAGAWTVNPLVATITLPTLPASTTWTALQFVKNGNVEKIIVSGGTTGIVHNFYFSYIKVSDDTVWNLPLTTQNTYTVTQQPSPTNIYGVIRNIIYDYINELIYFQSLTGTNGAVLIKLNLATNVFTYFSSASFQELQTANTVINEFQFNPIDERFLAIGNFSMENSRTYCYQTYQNNSNKWGYIYNQNRSITTGDSFGKLNFFDSGGLRTAGTSIGEVSPLTFTCLDIKGFHKSNQVFMTNAQYYSIINYVAVTAKKGACAVGLASPNHLLVNLMQSFEAGLFFALNGTGTTNSYTPVNRLICFDTTQATADFGYLNLPVNANMMTTNQLIL